MRKARSCPHTSDRSSGAAARSAGEQREIIVAAGHTLHFAGSKDLGLNDNVFSDPSAGIHKADTFAVGKSAECAEMSGIVVSGYHDVVVRYTAAVQTRRFSESGVAEVGTNRQPQIERGNRNDPDVAVAVDHQLGGGVVSDSIVFCRAAAG